MQTIADFPPLVIDQIIGTRDMSCFVINLWLCGNRQLNSKLSEGLLFLELSSHSLSKSCFPKLIQHLRSLRYFSIVSGKALIRAGESCTSLIEPLPPTLEFLEIYTGDGHDERPERDWRNLIWNHGVVTQHPRGPSETIDLETLFPRLHTLKLGPLSNRDSERSKEVFITSQSFPALPSSLTMLEARIRISSSDTLLMSSLPPNIRKIAKISWKMEYSSITEEDKAFEALRRNFLSAPSTLERMASEHSQWATTRQLHASSEVSYEYLLPKSLTAQKWENSQSPFWSPSLARTMPPTLQSLQLRNIDPHSFVTTFTNWVADLPRSLTKLKVVSHCEYEFPSYVRFLPRGLTYLALTTFNSGIYGDWSLISTSDWPSTLTSFELTNCWLEPSELAILPTTLVVLRVEISSELEKKPSLDAKQLPPSLTDLRLEWRTTKVDFDPWLSHLPLRICNLAPRPSKQLLFDWDWPSRFPNTIERLLLFDSRLAPPASHIKPDENVLPNLALLYVHYIDCRSLAFLPRRLRVLNIGTLDTRHSRLASEGHLFKHLPSPLVKLTVSEILFDKKEDILPPQELEHLRSLQHLEIDHDVGSKQLGRLPPSIRFLHLRIPSLESEDPPFIPGHLESAMIRGGSQSTEIIEALPIRCLSSFHFDSSKLRQIAKRRVQEAAKHP